MRLKFLVPLVLLAALLALPAAASAKLKVGISENNWQMFSDPNFQALGVDTTRLVTAYNVMEAAARGDDELSSRVRPYLAAAAAAGIEPLVTFEHARGAGELCKKNRSLPQCILPTPARYEANIRAFLQEFPQVRVIAPFNEANHFTQPTARNPKAAAKFTRIAEKVCKELARGCVIVAVDVLDQADSAKAKKPKFRSTTKWIKTFKRAYKGKLGICGLHNYSDVNRFRDAGTKALIKALGCKKYWLTESGGLYDFGSFWTKSTKKLGRCKSAKACQVKAMKHMFKILRRNRKIERAYVYTWFGGHTPRFDAGIVQGGPGEATKPRPVYREVKKYT